MSTHVSFAKDRGDWGHGFLLWLLLSILTFVGLERAEAAQSVTLAWNANTETNLAGYRLYYGTASRGYAGNVQVATGTTTATVTNLQENLTYYFAVTAFCVDGLESDYSDEVSYRVPGTSTNAVPVANAGSVSTAEDQAVAVTLTGSDANGDTLTYAVTTAPANGTLSGTAPNLTYTPNANFNGADSLAFRVSDGRTNSAIATVTITVSAVNDVPTLAAVGNVSVNEDAGAQTVALSGIGTGAGNESQALTVTAVSSNPALVPNPAVTYASPATTGSLSLTPAANANGTATITVTVNDGQAQNNTSTRTFTVTVAAVNDAPTLGAIGNLSVPQNAGAQTVALSGIGTGAANESQTLSVTATSSNPSLVPNPTVTYTSPNATGSLGFTPVGGASGTATITVTVNDGQAQNNTAVRTFTVTVAAGNQPPTLAAIAPVTVNEDAGLQTVALSGIGPGATNESQTLTVTATSSNPSLVPNPTVTYTSPNTTGSLGFTPAANASGTATITVTVNDGQAQNNTFSQSFLVTVNAVNDAPTLAALSNVTMNEDAGAQTVALSGIGTGAANETQTLSVTATSSNPSLIPNPSVTYTSPNATGSLAFTPVANANGTATITVTVNDGQAQNNTLARTFTVTVNAVNDAPTLAALANVSLSEDAGAQTVALSGIAAGGGNESQTLSVTATSSNPSLIPNPAVTYASPNATGSLAFTPVTGANGTATITVTVNDGQAQNNTVSQTFTVSVGAVNDAPTLAAIANVTVSEDGGAQTVALSGIGSGATNEVQALTVTAVSSDVSLVPNPTVTYTSPNATGSLSFTPVANANGTATITVTVNDGQAQNNTVVRTFTVTVNAVNDAPTLAALANATVNEDAGAQTVALAGIGTGAANESQTLSVTATSSNPSLIPNPAVTYASPNTTGSLSFTPVANASGIATITVTVNDGQAQNNTLVRTFTVTVNAVNDVPTLAALSNVSLNENAGAQTVALSGIGAGAANETQTLSVTATSSNPSLIPNPTVTYTSPNATGSLAFTPVTGANGTATITVTVNDGQAQNSTVSQTFTVSVGAVNDAPTLAAIANVTVNEDAGAQTVALSGIGSGATNEVQALTVTAVSSNPSLIPNPTVTYTSPSATGSLAFTPAADASGAATITVTVNDGQAQNNTVVRTFTVTVNAVNDAPTLAALSNLSLNEDAGAQTVALAGIGTGAADEAQALTVTATSSNPSLIPNPAVTYASPNTTGSLSLTPVANANGTATITVTVNDGQAQNNTLVRTFTVTVNAVNDVPTLAALSNVSLNENAGAQTVALSGIGAGAANETQTLSVTSTSSNPSLIPNPTVTYTSPNATGSLRFTPVTGANGTATITVTVNDGQAQNSTVSQTFTVSVGAVNDAPTLAAIANVTVNEDAGAQIVALSGIGSGATNEVQALTVTAVSSNPSLIPNPTVTYTSPSATGSLAFTPAADASGAATITVTVNDGQAQNNTVVRTFTVTVNAVNDAPTLAALSNLSLNEDAGAQTVALAGIGTGAADEVQTLTVTAVSSNPTLVPNPAVTYASPNTTGSLNLTPAANASGTATVTVTVNDGQAQNNTVVRTFTVTVAAVNDVPTLAAIADLSLAANPGAQTVALSGIGAGAANETQTLSVTAVSSNPSLIPNPTVTYVSPNTTGSLGFTPVANASGSAVITVTVNDGQAQNNTVVRTFTVTVAAGNQAPTLAAIGNVTVNEDAGAQTVALSGIGAGGSNEVQTLAVTAVSSNPSLVPNPTVTYVSPNTTGSLSLTPAANTSGTATITVTVNDGQSLNNTAVRTFTVTVNPVNDVPTLATLSNVSINEDAAAQTVVLSGIGAGAPDEGQTLVVTATSSNPSLVPNPSVTYTSPGTTGSLSFTPAANANGVATITVAVNDGQAQNNTVTQTFTVTVNAVNDAPTLAALGNLSVAQDPGLQTVTLSGIGSGAANEAQTLSVTAVSGNPSLIPNPVVTYSSPNASGSLAFTPVAGASGSATITVTVNDGQAQNNTAVRSFTVTVAAGNQAPTIAAVSDLTVTEDAGAQTVALSGIGPGAASESQTLTLTATSSNPSLVPNPVVTYSSPSATGSLSFTPAANATGTATITVTVNDGQALNSTTTETFVITVTPVNDAPLLGAIGDITMNEDGGVQTVALTGISSGAANESQVLAITAVSSDPSVVANPVVNYTSPSAGGSLSVTPAAGASGSAVITVTVNDGQAQNSTVVRTFTVTVNALNDAPTLAAVANLTVNEDAGLQTVALSGIGTGAADEDQALTVTAVSSNPSLIPNPTVTYTSPGASGSLSFTPVANASGTATVTVTVNDGQAQNGSASRTFTVTVNSVNDAPTLDPLANVSLTQNPGQQTVALSGIGSGAANESQTLTVTATSSNPSLVPNPTVTYASPAATGTLTFTPSSSSGSATITVTVNDGQSQNATVTRTFLVSVAAVNLPPTLNPLTDLVINEDAAQQLVNLRGISPGAVTEVQTLTVTAVSSNPELIPQPAVTYSSPNSGGYITFRPVANGFGTATITVTVSDGQASDNSITRSFLVTVNPVNDAPTLAVIADQDYTEDTGSHVVTLTGIGMGATNENQLLVVTASSSNPSAIPHPIVTYSSPSATGTLTITPAANLVGSATITVSVQDGGDALNQVTRNFYVAVRGVNDAPVLSEIPDQAIETSSVSDPIPFIVSDVDTAITSVRLSAVSADTVLLPASGLVFGGSGTNRTLTITPALGRMGATTVTVAAADGYGTNTRTFNVTVGNLNQTPTVTSIPNQTMDVSTTLSSVSFQVADAETTPANLVVTAVSADKVLLPDTGLAILGTSTTRQLAITPAPGRTGSTVVTVTVSDGVRQAQTTFQLTVQTVQSRITVTVVGSGTVSPDLNGQLLTVGQTYTVTAIPDAGQVFASWSGDLTSYSASLTFVMQRDLSLVANFEADALVLAAGTYNGLVAETDQVRQEQSGNFTLTSTTRGTYSGKLQVGASRLSIKGLLGRDGKATNVVARTGLSPLTVEVSVGVSGADLGRISGRVTDGVWSAEVQGDRQVYNAKTNPAPFAGSYTLLLPADEGSVEGPRGDGYGTVKIDANGIATFIGLLADGTKGLQRVPLSQEGQWPFYLPLYKGGGAALGWLALNGDQTELGGLVSWIKPAIVSKYYPGGFTNESQVVGATYVPPTTTEQQGGGVRRTEFLCSGGDLSDVVTGALMLLPNGKMVTQTGSAMKLGVSPTTGLFKGTVLDPGTGKPRTFSGVLLQKWNVGAGLILGLDEVGRIEVNQQ